MFHTHLSQPWQARDELNNSALGKGQKSCQDAQTWLCITIKKGSVASEYKTEFKFNKFSNNWVKLTSISSWVVKSSVLQERLYYVPWFLIFHSELAAALPTSLFFYLRLYQIWLMTSVMVVLMTSEIILRPCSTKNKNNHRKFRQGSYLGHITPLMLIAVFPFKILSTFTFVIWYLVPG